MTKESEKNNELDKNASIKLTPHQERVRDASIGRKFNVYNVVEMIAKENVIGMMDRVDMCTCSKCAGDVLALALNSLPTKYVTSDAGKQYIQLETYKKQFETDVDIALMKACFTVKAAPSHDPE